ncbi:MAG: hypothetical protein HQL46_16670 [Gammaproteobacteria bacterium]|nr:hypothetical protein [Gammaproteobacteria bacterium]
MENIIVEQDIHVFLKNGLDKYSVFANFSTAGGLSGFPTDHLISINKSTEIYKEYQEKQKQLEQETSIKELEEDIKRLGKS